MAKGKGKIKRHISAYERKTGRKKLYPVEIIVMVNDPHDPNTNKRLVDPVYEEAPYIECKTPAEFVEYFGGFYNATILPYLGSHYRAFVNPEEHPRKIKTPEALLEKSNIIEDSGIADAIKADLKDEGLDEKDMSVKQLNAYIKVVKERRKKSDKLRKIVKDSGYEKEVRASLLASGKTLAIITEDELLALLKNIELANK